MKTVIAIVVLIAGGFLAIGYGSYFALGTIDGGMHHGKKKNGRKVNTTAFQKRLNDRQTLKKAKENYVPQTVTDPGKVNSNPFAN